jgi:hypothetical protein
MDVAGFFGDDEGDAPVQYRTGSDGLRIGVIPRTCKAGLHDLAVVGYRPISGVGNTSEPGEILIISCLACKGPNHYWQLVMSGPPPDRSELDDGPYRDAMTQRIVRPSRGDRG